MFEEFRKSNTEEAGNSEDVGRAREGRRGENSMNADPELHCGHFSAPPAPGNSCTGGAGPASQLMHISM